MGLGLLVHVVVHQQAHRARKPDVGDDLSDNVRVHCNTSFLYSPDDWTVQLNGGWGQGVGWRGGPSPVPIISIPQRKGDVY